jgi:hypothetical protein
MSDQAQAVENQNGAGAGVTEAPSSAKVELPPFVDGQLGKERAESLRKDVERDPDLAKELSELKGLPEVFDKWRAQRNSLKGTVRLPKEGDGKEVWDQWYKAIGRPESANDYAFEKTNLPPEGMVDNAGIERWFREEAYNLGLSSAAAKKFFNDFNEFGSKTYTTQLEAIKQQEAKQAEDREATRKRELDESRTAMQRKWGERYKEKLTKIVTTLSNPQIIAPALYKTLDEAGVVRTPEFLEFMDKYASLVSEDRKIGITGEEGEAPQEEKTPGRLPKGFFKKTAKRYSV